MTQKIEVDISELRQITSWLAAVDVEFIEIVKPGATIRLTMELEPRHAARVSGQLEPHGTAAAPGSAPEAGRKPAATIAANSVGVFLATHPARATPLVGIGAQVKRGDIVGLLQIAQLCAPVVAPINGVVTRVLAAHGAKVGYGTALLEIAPSA